MILPQSTPFLIVLTMSYFSVSGCTDALSEPEIVQSEAEAAFQAGGDLAPTAKTLYAVARILSSQGRDAQCEPVLRRIIQEYPGFLPAYAEYSRLLIKHQKINEAVATISEGLKISPRDPLLLNNLGMCWMMRNNYEMALAMFTRAAAVLPENARYRANMAASLGMMGRFEESYALFNQVVPLNDAFHNVKVLYYARRRSLDGDAGDNEDRGGQVRHEEYGYH